MIPPMSDTPIKIKVYVVTVHLTDGNEPCLPRVFGTREEAETHLEESIREDWEAEALQDGDGNALPYPGNWRAAHDALCERLGNDYGEWALNVVEVEIPAVNSMVWALQTARGAIASMGDQIGQMSGMFDDEDGTIAEACEDGACALNDIAAALALVQGKA